MLNKLHKITRDYFSLTNKEASGLLVVFVAILFFSLTPLTFSLFPNKLDRFTNEKDQRMLDSLVAIIDKAYDYDTSKHKGEFSSKHEPIDINTISLSKLKAFAILELKIAERIVKFRDKLGGFHSIEQLDEVYGLKAQQRNKLKAILFVENTFEVTKLAINTLSFQKMLAHPYLNYSECKLIFSSFRNQHKTIKKTTDLVDEGIIDSKKAKKLEPYLIFD